MADWTTYFGSGLSGSTTTSSNGTTLIRAATPGGDTVQAPAQRQRALCVGRRPDGLPGASDAGAPLMRHAAVLVACVAVALAMPAGGPLDAQRVAGRVSIPGGFEPGAGGILVVAKDSAGTEIARAVTAEDGRYSLPLPRAGRTKVELHQVGFDPTVVLDRAVAPSEAVALDAEAGRTLVILPTRSSSSTTCREGSDARYVEALWNEVRTALLTTQVGLARPGLNARWVAADHRLAQNQRDTTRYSLIRRSGALLGAFGSPVLNDLQRSGYVVSAGNDRIFRGLDVSTMLSPWFRENYCLTATDERPGTFQVAFAPKVRKRDYVDVSGEFLLERGSMELLLVSYEYVGLPSDEDKRGAGGRIAFGRTDGGTWLVKDWTIRFPHIGVIELQTFRAQDRGRVLQPDVLGVEVLGGYTTALLEGTRRIYVRELQADGLREQAAIVRTACGERVIAAATGAAKGRLTVDGRPVSGSRIRATWRVQIDVGGEVPLWRDEMRETVSSNRGEWTLCDLPHDASVALSWEVQGRRSETSLRVRRDQVVNVGPDGKVIDEP
jgi:hypothetical protein